MHWAFRRPTRRRRARGLCRRGGRLGRPDRRDARRGGAAATRRPRWTRATSRAPVSVARPNRVVPLEQIARVTTGLGCRRSSTPTAAAPSRCRPTRKGRSPGEVTPKPLKLARSLSFRPFGRWRASRPAGGVRRHVHRGLFSGIALMPPGAGGPVRFVHRAAAGDDQPAAVADRRCAGACWPPAARST